jgi:hypothetical protein
LDAAVSDERTVYVDLEGTALPVLLPIALVKDFKLSYLTHRGLNVESTYFMPAYGTLASLGAAVNMTLRRELGGRHEPSAVILTYSHWQNAGEQDYLSRALAGSHELPLVDAKTATQACITHFDGLVIPQRAYTPTQASTLRDVFLQLVDEGELRADVRDGVTVLDPNDGDGTGHLAEQLWDMCDPQFSDLVAELPIEQEFTRDEFLDLLSDPLATTIVHLSAGAPDCMSTFLHDLSAAPWLNEAYCHRRFGDEFLCYFVMMAKGKGAKGRPSLELMDMLIRLTRALQRPVRIAFECTNVSATYIPRVVSLAINSSREFCVDIEETAAYLIRAFFF